MGQSPVCVPDFCICFTKDLEQDLWCYLKLLIMQCNNVASGTDYYLVSRLTDVCVTKEMCADENACRNVSLICSDKINY